MIDFRIVDNPKELKQAYRLRYKVYCEEYHFIEPHNCPKKGLEYDEYDEYSVHFLAESDKKVIGTARFVLDSSLEFPTEEYFELPSLNINRKQMGEISRVIVAKDFRSIDHKIMLGLIGCAYKYWKQHDIKYILASMRSPLLNFFQRVGFPLKMIKGYKLRTDSKNIKISKCFIEKTVPAIVSVKEIETNLRENCPHIYALFTSSGPSRNKGFEKVKSNLFIPA